MRCKLLVTLVLLAGAACEGELIDQYELKMVKVNDAKSVQLEVFDVNGDRAEDIVILEEEHLGAGNQDVLGHRIEYFPFHYNSVYDQINLSDPGFFLARRDEKTDRTIFAVMSIFPNRTSVIREYDMEGPLLREIPLPSVPDRNGNDLWDGHALPVFSYDIDADGWIDYIVNYRASMDWAPRAFTAFSGRDGSILWDFSCPSIPNSDNSSFADLDGDGVPEVIVCTSACANGVTAGEYDDFHSYLFVLDIHGKKIWEETVGGKFTDVRLLSVGDADDDGRRDITFLKEGHNEFDPEQEGIYLRDGMTGKEIKFFQSSRRFQQHYTTADINSDGRPEHVLLDRNGGIAIYDQMLNETAAVSIPDLFDARGITTFDFDEDGDREIVIYIRTGETRIYTQEFKEIASTTQAHTGTIIYGARYRELDPGVGKANILLFDNGQVQQLVLERNLATIAADLRTPIIIGSVFIIAALLIILLKRTGDLEMEKSKLRHLLAAEDDRGIVVIDNKYRIENLNDALVRYVEPHTLREIGGNSEGESLSQSIRGLLDRLRESPSQEMGVHGVPVRLHHENKSVDILARKITDHRGDTRGVVVNIRDTWQQQWARTAAENVHIGQELMHKIKTLISVYRNDIYMLRKLVEENATRDRYLEIINEMFAVSEDITEITKAFLSLSKIDHSRRELTDFNRLLVDTVKPVAGSTQKSINFDFQLSTDLAAILIDQEQIQSLILNLVENAINAVEDDGRIILRTEFFRRFSEEAKWGLRDYLALSIEDTGRGFDEKLVTRIFEPGYSGFPGRVGLGLTISKRIVDNHEGEIFISSVENKGTIVTVRLPYKN